MHATSPKNIPDSGPNVARDSAGDAASDSGPDPQFAHDVRLCFEGAAQRAIPARWLYDFAGSQIFDTITDLPEYYPTRTETALLGDILDEAADIIGPQRTVVEFGAGSVTKTPLLLNAVAPHSFVPIDISGDFLRSSVQTLQKLLPNLPIYPVEADFMKPVTMPDAIAGHKSLGFFPGSTIGNMVPVMAVDLLRSMHQTLGEGAMLMIGFDRKKNPSVLIRAYDDSAGVTSAFNLNLLARINRELDGDIDIDKFEHVARWNKTENRIEMHLRAICDVRFTIGGAQYSMAKDETIHTENSHKYDIEEAQTLLRAAGWGPLKCWSDEKNYFSIILALASHLPSAP